MIQKMISAEKMACACSLSPLLKGDCKASEDGQQHHKYMEYDHLHRGVDTKSPPFSFSD